ncbi:hypothetical protein SAMN05720470_10865 [Fibrobacter sp. UWOV1]|uniref:hypothetical protein n=1 Tax=Fibrobacter sp. UWOV1 TaxID=1896215 RepID=UPI0009124D76|nr:hypothetical protein [Fibrobacter sp. UWOV1]SHL43162.1 hypothetical protein SAMN05720470_10865 [Fibrobacter sp. UWOV1]
MKDRLKKSKLRIERLEFSEGRRMLIDLKQNDGRRYPLEAGVRLSVVTNQGTLHVQTAPGFTFDGRSGPKIVDWYAPNLGNIYEKVSWLVHDCNGYGQDLSFKDTNVLLYAMLRDLAEYRPSKCAVIQLAVSLSDSWYGEPKEDDWCYANRHLVSTFWIEKPSA